MPQNAQVLWYLSKRLSKAELNYWPTELEVAALVWIVRGARHTIESIAHPVTIYIDHRSIEDLRKAISLKSTNAVRQNLRLTRAALYLNQYHFNLEYIPGPQNVLADDGAIVDKFVDLTEEAGLALPSSATADSILDNFWVNLLDATNTTPAACQEKDCELQIYFAENLTLVTMHPSLQLQLMHGYMADAGFRSRIEELLTRMLAICKGYLKPTELTYNNFRLSFTFPFDHPAVVRFCQTRPLTRESLDLLLTVLPLNTDAEATTL